MSFHKQLKKILNKEKQKFYSIICTNFWCKVRHQVKEEDYDNNPDLYSQCKKCRSFSNEMSGGVTNNGVKEYEGTRNDPDIWDKYVEGEVEFKSLGQKNNKY